MIRRLLLVAVYPLLLGATGPCSGPNSRAAVSPPLEEEGTIHQGVGPECPQTWYIATSDGRMLWPVDDPAFQQDGLRVRFTARERTDALSICMAGTIVEVISIRKI